MMNNNIMDDSSSLLLISNHQMNENEVDYLALLLTIIESKNWVALRCSICSSPDTFQRFARKVARVGMSILHACVRFNPPLHIVQVLIELLPESPSFVDCMNQTALHIAAGIRADLSVIQLLLNASPFSCTFQDVNGMTPLHLACDSTCEIYTRDEDEDYKRDPPTYDVISTLINAYPTAATLKDKEGNSALKHAILSDAPIDVVMYLQVITGQQNQMKAQQGMKIKKCRRQYAKFVCFHVVTTAKPLHIVQDLKSQYSRQKYLTMTLASRYLRVLIITTTTTLLLSLFSPTKGFLQSRRVGIGNPGLIECTRNRNHYGWFGTRSNLASLANSSNDAVLDEALDPVTKAEVRRVVNHLAKQTLESLLSPSDLREMANELIFENNSKSTILNDATYLQYVKLWKKIENRLRKEDKRTPADLLGKELTERILSSIRGDGRRGNYDPQTVLTFLESDAINSLLTKLLYDAIFEFTMKIDIIGNAISNLPLLGPVRNQVLKESKRNMDRTLGPLLQRFLSGYTRVATRQAVDFMVSPENSSSFGKANVGLVSYLLEKRSVADWLPDESALADGREEIWKYLIGLEGGDGNSITKDDQKKIVEQSIEWMYDLAGDKSIEDVGLNINDILDASPTLERSLGKFWHTCLTASKSL